MKKNVIRNIIQLYGLSIAKMIFPLITLPYLTRIFNVDTYGTIAYVKSVMSYMQLIVDFGFMFSGTKEIIECKNDKEKIGNISGKLLLARIFLCTASFSVLVILTTFLPILRSNIAYTLLSFIPVLLSVFLFDYVFRGLEKMYIITNRFVVMKGISTFLTVLLIKNDSQLLLIPILDIIGSLFAVVLVCLQLKKMGITLKFGEISSVLSSLKVSAVYFASDMASTIFGALNTVVIGAFLTARDVAFWSVCIQLITAIQTMYSPITNGVYPEMIRTKNINNIYKLLKIFMPIITAGCLFTIAVANYALLVVGGKQYIEASYLLRMLTPILWFSFPAMLLGWPTLGSINKQKEVSVTTIVSAFVQILGLFILYALNSFNLITLAILRTITEFILFISRMSICLIYKNRFVKNRG